MEKILWVDLGEFKIFKRDDMASETWQDHGLGILRTIMHKNNVLTDIVSLRNLSNWEELREIVKNYDIILMNVRSYNFPYAKGTAEIFKEVNPSGLVIVGGTHAKVATNEMEVIKEFDHICIGFGEEIIIDLVKNPTSYPRIVNSYPSKSLNDWPDIDRTLWPKPNNKNYPWPLEPASGVMKEGPLVSVLTSMACPWQCSFCNELSFIPSMARKSVDRVIDELNYLDDTYGPIGSVAMHESMFFQNPSWLEEWIEKYPKRANKVWPYWAAARSDTIRKWPDLFERLVRETNWNTISIGFESGSDRVLKILNKGCTVEDNAFAIDFINRLGDEYVSKGKEPPRIWANIMLGIPGETKEDVFDTMRMIKHMKYVKYTITHFAPYPGSALGNQLIAEGKSLMTNDAYHRYAGDEKVKGVDYDFLKRVQMGEFNKEIMSKVDEWGKKS